MMFRTQILCRNVTDMSLLLYSCLDLQVIATGFQNSKWWLALSCNITGLTIKLSPRIFAEVQEPMKSYSVNPWLHEWLQNPSTVANPWKQNRSNLFYCNHITKSHHMNTAHSWSDGSDDYPWQQFHGQWFWRWTWWRYDSPYKPEDS